MPHDLQGELAGDRIYPYFMVTQLPPGLRGILIAAIFAAAMSSIDSSLNCVSSLTLLDFYARYVNRSPDEKKRIRMLRTYTILWGVLGTLTGLAMIQVETALETAWQLAGVAGGGLIGLFLLGVSFRRELRWQAVTAVIVSVTSIAWATFARGLPEGLQWMECTWHPRMIGVIGTVTLLTVGFGLGVMTGKSKQPGCT